MKIAWVVDVWPCGSCGTGPVRDLVALGHAVSVIAGRVDRAADPAGFSVHVIARADPFSGHWQRSRSSSFAAAFRVLLREIDPDVVHVHQWRSLSRDLVFAAALERRPAVVSLHDVWVSCLIGTRVLPATGTPCDSPLSAHPCLSCAPRTPWVPIEAQYMAFAEHKSAIVRELELARAVIVRDRVHGDAIRRQLGEDIARIDSFIDSADAALVSIYEASKRAGAPDVARPAGADWYTERMKAFAEAEWERGARAAGFDRHAR